MKESRTIPDLRFWLHSDQAAGLYTFGAHKDFQRPPTTSARLGCIAELQTFRLLRRIVDCLTISCNCKKASYASCTFAACQFGPALLHPVCCYARSLRLHIHTNHRSSATPWPQADTLVSVQRDQIFFPLFEDVCAPVADLYSTLHQRQAKPRKSGQGCQPGVFQKLIRGVFGVTKDLLPG